MVVAVVVLALLVQVAMLGLTVVTVLLQQSQALL
jgi:hypothetical protein